MLRDMSRDLGTKKKQEPATLSKEKLREFHSLMVKARVLEERIIKMGKAGEGYFWIGGPGEEAFSIPLGSLIRKGRGLDYDFLHLHYRASGILTAMGAPMIDTIRQMRSVDTDPYSGGRNFVNHYAVPEWNIVPITSCIEPQYAQAIGTAHAQRKQGCKGISIVTGGDAGTAEGDFATCLIWSSRPAAPLPVLIIVTNNHYGISTAYEGQHGETNIADRGKAFNIKSEVINGNDVWEAYDALSSAMDYVRRERQPFLLEVEVSRLYGHSSASGANRVNEFDCIKSFEEKLLQKKILSEAEIKTVWDRWQNEANEALKQARQEPFPDPATIYDHVWAEENGDKGRDTFAEQIGMDYSKMPGKGEGEHQ